MSLDQWSTTPASNDIANYFQTGMRPSSVKTAGWDIMADLAQLLNANPTVGGTANAITVANARPFASLTDGLTCIFIPTAENTGTGGATFAPDGLTAHAINVGANTSLCGGELRPGVPAILKYKVSTTSWNLLNPCGWPFYRSTSNTGGTNSITTSNNLSPRPAPANLIDGMTFSLKIGATTTASPTLNINSLGALNIYYSDGVTQLAAGSLIQNNVYEFIYDSSLNASAGGFICVNPSPVAGTFTGTLTGYATPPTGTVNYVIGNDGKTFRAWTASAITGTSNANTLTMTGVPAILASAFSKELFCVPTDNGGTFYGSMITNTGSTWTFVKANSLIGFTASGTKGLGNRWYVTGTLD